MPWRNPQPQIVLRKDQSPFWTAAGWRLRSGVARGFRRRKIVLPVPLQAQPSETSCGPTCLQAVYAYYGDHLPLDRLINEIPSLETGGTLGVLLGLHALRRGYRATLYSSSLNILDPTWFQEGSGDLGSKLARQARQCRGKRRLAAEAYLEFVAWGGEVRLEDLTGAVVRYYLQRGMPILAGLSSTYLYREAREDPDSGRADDIQGLPQGHFVILSGYQAKRRRVTLADPYQKNPLSSRRLYAVTLDRLVNAILLGVLTYDGNLLIVWPEAQGR